MLKVYKNIKHYKKYEEENRGTNSKEWVMNDDTLYLHKITQIKKDGTSTNAHYSESIYSDIALILGLDCVKVTLVKKDNKEGIITELFLSDNEELIDFNALIQNIRIDYIPKDLKCKSTKEYYSIELIIEAIKSVISDRREFIKIRKKLIERIILDALCDHYDRNPSNLALIKNYGLEPNKRYRLSPIFDNGTSLYASLPVEVAKDYLNKENGLIELDNAIRSKIGIGTERGTTYDILLDYIMKNYFEDTIDLVDRINYLIDENTLNTILNQHKYRKFDKYHKDLIYNKILFNKDKINTYYNIYNKVDYQKTKVKD